MSEMIEENLIPNNFDPTIESFNKELAESIHDNLSDSLTNIESIQLIKLLIAFVILLILLKLVFLLISKINTFLFSKEHIFNSIKLIEARLSNCFTASSLYQKFKIKQFRNGA